MAIFGTKKNTKKAVAAASETKSEVVASASKKTEASSNSGVLSVANVLVRPRITEKAANMTTANVYVFEVAKSATKKDIAAAVKELYKVTPEKVNVVNTKGAPVRLRRKRGFGAKSSTRKAYVFLKKGDSIQLA